MGEKLDGEAMQQFASEERGESWWLLADIVGELIPDTLWRPALVVLLACGLAALIRTINESAVGA